MKSLVGISFLSLDLLFAFAGCSVDTPDELTDESVNDGVLVDKADTVSDAYNFECASGYVIPQITLPVGLGFHQIAMSWDRNHLEAGGSFQVDPNACVLDMFGDRTICTKMAVQANDMRLWLLAEKPGARAYAIAARPHGSTVEYSTLPLRLVTITEQGEEQMRLLVVNTDQTIGHSIEMH